VRPALRPCRPAWAARRGEAVSPAWQPHPRTRTGSRSARPSGGGLAQRRARSRAVPEWGLWFRPYPFWVAPSPHNPGPGLSVLRILARGARVTGLCGHFHLDGPGPGFLAERQLHGQHAVLVVGRHFSRIHRRRQRERAREAAVTPLDPANLLFLHVRRPLP